MRFSPEQISMLAEAERGMDRGELFFVVMNGQRLLVQDDVAKEFGLERGQTITPTIHLAVLEAQLASCRAQIALKKVAQKQEPSP